jgi:hypothetical protein
MPRANMRLVQKYLNDFEHNKRYREADIAIKKLIQAFPSHSDLSEVLLKVTTINKLYSTNIMAPFDVAKHIISQNVSAEIQEGDFSAVEKIRFVTFAGVRKNFYSFATKYCSWHNLTSFPIYDTFVAKSLQNFGTVQGDLRVYKNLKSSIDELIRRDALNGFSYKEIDKFLWAYGKGL